MRDAIASAHLYPDGGGFYLREALAARLNLARENLILGNGSNEVIEFVGHAFLKPGDEIVASQYAFIVYKLVAKLFDARVIETPSPDYRHDLEAMFAAITPKTKVVFIANPNNPTGTLIPQAEIDRFVTRVPERVIVVFDEAYFEFLDHPPDTLQYVREGRNVMVVRTFSKIHGLAGLRVGYGMARAELIEVLQKTREPFNVNSIAQIGALAALDDEDHQRKTKSVVDAGRAYLEEQFNRMKVRFVPTTANFIMVNVGDGPAVFKNMLARKIIVRPLKGYKLQEWVRITIGTMEENRRCVTVLEEILPKHREH